MKKFMMSLVIASIAMVSFAQETVTSEVVVPTLKNSVSTNSFWSNWFVSVNGGLQWVNGVTADRARVCATRPKYHSPSIAQQWH